MGSIDSEIITWLFIAFAGAAFGAIALKRIFSRRDMPEKMHRGPGVRDAVPRRERIAARPSKPPLPKPELPPAPVKPAIFGPGRPSLLIFAAAKTSVPLLLIQRGVRFDDAIFFSARDPAPEGRALSLLHERLKALAHEPDDAFADCTWVISAPSGALPDDDSLVLLARDDKGAPMGEAVKVCGMTAKDFAAELRNLLPKAEAGVSEIEALRKEEKEMLLRLIGARIAGEGQKPEAEKFRSLLAAIENAEAGSKTSPGGSIEPLLDALRREISESDRALAQANSAACDPVLLGRALTLDHLLLAALLTRALRSGDYLSGMRSSAEVVRRALCWELRREASAACSELCVNLRRAEALLDQRALACGRMPRTLARIAEDGRIRFANN